MFAPFVTGRIGLSVGLGMCGSEFPPFHGDKIGFLTSVELLPVMAGTPNATPSRRWPGADSLSRSDASSSPRIRPSCHRCLWGLLPAHFSNNYGLVTRPMKRMQPDIRSRIKNMNARSARNSYTGSGGAEAAKILDAAAASVPFSSTWM